MKKKDLTFAEFMGIVFIIIGVIGSISIVASFDYGTYNEIKQYEATYADEIQFMKDNLFSTWVVGIGSLIGCVAIGTLFITLGKILGVLNDIKDSGKMTNEHKETV